MRRDAMRVSVTGEKQDLAAGELAAHDVGRRQAVGRLDRSDLAQHEPAEFGQASAADNGVDGHGIFPWSIGVISR